MGGAGGGEVRSLGVKTSSDAALIVLASLLLLLLPVQFPLRSISFNQALPRAADLDRDLDPVSAHRKPPQAFCMCFCFFFSTDENHITTDDCYHKTDVKTQESHADGGPITAPYST